MEIVKCIDHTLLKPEANSAQIEIVCREAAQFQFAAVCINSSFVPLCAKLLEDRGVAVCATVGFPLGAVTTGTKVFEAKEAMHYGAREIDMVLAVGRLKCAEHDYVLNDIAAVAKVVHGAGGVLKVILETCLLTDDQKRTACRLAVEAGADFVKTSTGFSTGGATVDDVRLLKAEVAGRAKVKASGGIRDYQSAMQMIAAGADRIGTSSGVAIVHSARAL